MEQSNSTTVQYCKVHQEVNVLATKSDNTTTLPTAQLRLTNNKSKITIRGLFDQGSKKTFISQQLSDKLMLRPLSQVKLNISEFLTNTEPHEVVKVLVLLESYASPV